MFDGYLLSFLSTYLSISDIVRLTKSSVLFREPILLETLERRILSECSVTISDKVVLRLYRIHENGVFVFEDESPTVSCSYFTNNHICLCDSNEIRIVLPNKTIRLDVPIAEMFHNYNDGNMVREYYDVDYTIKIHFVTTIRGLFINKIMCEIMRQELTLCEQIMATFRNIKNFLG